MSNRPRWQRIGIYPFWFWNGAMHPQDIRRDIERMAAAGVAGFYIHSRQGLEVPYLSQGFMDRVEVAMDAAAAHGMTVHLYDEFPYPSGVAGGEVFLGRPELLATRLAHVVKEFDGPIHAGLPRGEVLACVAVPLDGGRPQWDRAIDLRGRVGILLPEATYLKGGLTAYNRKRYLAAQPTPTVRAEHLSGRHRLVAVVQVVVKGHKYFGQFIDTLNPAVVDRFLQLTHDRYAARFRNRFAATAPTIFTDETTPHWSPRLIPAYREAYGEDLSPLLPALHCPDHPRHGEVRRKFFDLHYRLFVETFDQRVQQHCRSLGLRFEAEKNWMRLAHVQHCDVPGCEPGHFKAGAMPDVLGIPVRSNARAIVSAAYAYGKDTCLCECAHSLGWSATVEDLRIICDTLLVLGIERLVPHAFFHQTHGLAKHDAPPTFFHQMPWWPLFGKLSEHIAAIGEYFEGTRPHADVLLVEPHGQLASPAQLQAYQRIMHRLTELHREFLLVDTDVLAAAPVEAGQVRVRDIRAAAVLVPPLDHPEPALVEALRRIEQAGGRVVRLHDAGDVDAAVADIEPRLLLSSSDGAAERVWLGTRISRSDPGKVCHLLVNTSNATVDLRIGSTRPLSESSIDGLPPRLQRHGADFLRPLAPFETVLLTEDDDLGEPAAIVDAVLDAQVAWTLDRPNLLRLGTWELALLDSLGQVQRAATTAAAPIANQLAETGLPIAPRWTLEFGVPPQQDVPVMLVRYTTRFRCGYRGAVQLVMEPGTLRGPWTVQVNRGPALAAADFTPGSAPTEGCLGARIDSCLRPGVNEVTVTLRVSRPDDGLVNPLYLAGDFGVRLSGGLPQLVAPTTAGRFESWDANGLPFFAGIIEYRGTLNINPPPRRHRGPLLARLVTTTPLHDGVSIRVQDGPWQALPWSPRLFAIDTDLAGAGKVAVQVRVHTALLRAFEGQWFDHRRHLTREVAGTQGSR